jgi:hypothetical protein
MAYTKEKLNDLKGRLKEAGISNGQVARYAGYYSQQVSATLNGYLTISRIIEAAEAMAADPSLVSQIPDRSHPLKARLKEAGLFQMDLVRATGQKSGAISAMLQGYRRMPKWIHETAESLITEAKGREVGHGKE